MADAARIAAGLALVREAGAGSTRTSCSRSSGEPPSRAERDLYQGLVHVAVATYQDGRGNEVGRTRQLEKALRRLAPYAPSYEGIDIEASRVPGAGRPSRRSTAHRCPIQPLQTLRSS